MSPNKLTIAVVDAADFGRHLDGLAELLHACVHDGASVGFVLPFEIAESRGFWCDRVAPDVATGKRVLLVAHVSDDLAGTVQLGLDTPPNQPHRADIAKLLVHPRHRRLGVGWALMLEIEHLAKLAGRRLLTLDTRTDDNAEPLYLALGYELAGRVPGYARDPQEDRFDATSVMFKRLDA